MTSVHVSPELPCRICRRRCGQGDCARPAWLDSTGLCLVRSAKTDALATEVQRARAKGIQHPFIYTELAKFVPLGARGAGAALDEEEPETKEAAAIAKALGRSAASESQPLLAWTPWHMAFDAWSLAAAATEQIAYTSALAHKHVVLQAIARLSLLLVACARVQIALDAPL